MREAGEGGELGVGGLRRKDPMAEKFACCGPIEFHSLSKTRFSINESYGAEIDRWIDRETDKQTERQLER